ncbi:hypothetical protein TNCV_2302791 [Trichonephila clavipes]|nr:hypothetical protein TNCV_2302791 [Trichonephila clavipes]
MATPGSLFTSTPLGHEDNVELHEDYDEVSKTTSELAPPSLNFHTTPIAGRLNLDKFNVYSPLCTAGLQRRWLELMTSQPEVRGFDHLTTTAT